MKPITKTVVETIVKQFYEMKDVVELRADYVELMCKSFYQRVCFKMTLRGEWIFCSFSINNERAYLLEADVEKANCVMNTLNSMTYVTEDKRND